MRDDLLDSLACVDWAIAQSDLLEGRINRWINDRPYVAREHKDAQTGEETWQITEVDPIPRVINVEIGAIINALRSSLDVLATKLAERNGHFGKTDVYFPVTRSAATFKSEGRKKIRRLSACAQTAIERLQPYHGGDKPLLLLSLHNIDNARKHRQLIGVESTAPGVSIFRYGAMPETDDIMRAQAPDHGYVDARSSADPDYQIQVRIEVAFRDAGVLTGKPITPALRELISLTHAIIAIFDGP
jgi:hypothetical protein